VVVGNPSPHPRILFLTFPFIITQTRLPNSIIKRIIAEEENFANGLFAKTITVNPKQLLEKDK
jgi:hypothetical protein